MVQPVVPTIPPPPTPTTTPTPTPPIPTVTLTARPHRDVDQHAVILATAPKVNDR